MKKYLIIEHECLGGATICAFEMQLREILLDELPKWGAADSCIIGQYAFTRQLAKRLTDMPAMALTRISSQLVKLPAQPKGLQIPGDEGL